MRPIRVRLPDGSVRVGPVIDLRGDADGELAAAALARAILGGLPEEPSAPRVVRPAPTPVYPFVARLAAGMSFDRRGALATLARVRGCEADGHLVRELGRAREASAEASVPTGPDPETLADARRRAAEAGAETDRLRERAATVRGRVEAARAAGDGVDAAEEELAAAMARLSEVATERVAARQRLDVLEAGARRARTRREERMRLEDRAANLERAVRRSLAAAVYDAFADATAALPDAFDAEAGGAPGAFAGDSLSAALAVARAAPLRAPVVADAAVVDRFDSLADFARYVAAPVAVR